MSPFQMLLWKCHATVVWSRSLLPPPPPHCSPALSVCYSLKMCFVSFPTVRAPAAVSVLPSCFFVALFACCGGVFGCVGVWGWLHCFMVLYPLCVASCRVGGRCVKRHPLFLRCSLQYFFSRLGNNRARAVCVCCCRLCLYACCSSLSSV